ncbi:hypothetical protein [Bailinhaonella thermotolerans]|uniref:Uncharacterized protein n=1 Tax=Bailinhaonella thermotolerans TaxID=1070861 RepID=A0A3A4AQR5_9ACTN|nr:hypothetical protein [Bailinhaonella thermotolerans]RJL23598.1 hypothetical protein D5H75_32360 [Bailinhaonella thermotolerans]
MTSGRAEPGGPASAEPRDLYDLGQIRRTDEQLDAIALHRDPHGPCDHVEDDPALLALAALARDVDQAAGEREAPGRPCPNRRSRLSSLVPLGVVALLLGGTGVAAAREGHLPVISGDADRPPAHAVATARQTPRAGAPHPQAPQITPSAFPAPPSVLGPAAARPGERPAPSDDLDRRTAGPAEDRPTSPPGGAPEGGGPGDRSPAPKDGENAPRGEEDRPQGDTPGDDDGRPGGDDDRPKGGDDRRKGDGGKPKGDGGRPKGDSGRPKGGGAPGGGGEPQGRETKPKDHGNDPGGQETRPGGRGAERRGGDGREDGAHGPEGDRGPGARGSGNGDGRDRGAGADGA